MNLEKVYVTVKEELALVGVPGLHVTIGVEHHPSKPVSGSLIRIYDNVTAFFYDLERTVTPQGLRLVSVSNADKADIVRELNSEDVSLAVLTAIMRDRLKVRRELDKSYEHQEDLR
jgi:hypothetical protein